MKKVKVVYDKYYQEENLFGSPYDALIEFFSQHNPKGNILDIGCGQGRDSIELAKMGYVVHGIDISSVGLNQLKEYSKAHNLNITVECKDMYSEDIDLNFDIILLDSMFHFYKKDLDKEKDLLIKIFKRTRRNTIIAIFMQKGKYREEVLKETIKDNLKYDVLEDKYIDYEAHIKQPYLMFIVKKIQ